MNRIGLAKLAWATVVLAIGFSCTASKLAAQGIAGVWHGSRSDHNPLNGQMFTVNFIFWFNSNGTYEEQASFGSWTVLKLTGTYSLAAGRNPSDPTVTAILRLDPQSTETSPNEQALMLLQSADIPVADSTEQYVTFFNVAPLGGMSLKNRNGGETWGLNRFQ